MWHFSPSANTPKTRGLGASPFSPILLQNRTSWYLVLAFMATKRFSHSDLSCSILSLGSLMCSPGSGRPWITRLSLLPSLSLSSSSSVLSIFSCSPSVFFACSLSSLLKSSVILLTSSILSLLSATFASVSSCRLLTSLIWVFHLLLKFMQDLQAQ